MKVSSEPSQAHNVVFAVHCFPKPYLAAPIISFQMTLKFAKLLGVHARVSPMNHWLLRTQKRWADILPDNLASTQSENELQHLILRGVAQGARVFDIARCLGLTRAQVCQLHKAALSAKAVPVLVYFKAREEDAGIGGCPIFTKQTQS